MLLGFFSLFLLCFILFPFTKITLGFYLHLWPSIYYICATKDKQSRGILAGKLIKKI